MGNGTDVAIESSDIVLMNSNFNRLPMLLGLAKRDICEYETKYSNCCWCGDNIIG